MTMRSANKNNDNYHHQMNTFRYKKTINISMRITCKFSLDVHKYRRQNECKKNEKEKKEGDGEKTTHNEIAYKYIIMDLI